jgi:hypothetical protein
MFNYKQAIDALLLARCKGFIIFASHTNSFQSRGDTTIQPSKSVSNNPLVSHSKKNLSLIPPILKRIAYLSNSDPTKHMNRAVPDKSEIAQMQPFVGLVLADVRLLSNPSDYANAMAEIKAAGLVGFDTESKPTFVTGEASTGPHLVQFSLPDKAFLFQPQRVDGLPFLLNLLQSPEVIKVGFGLKSDRKQIYASLGIQLHATIDINSLFSRQGYRKDLGVRTAVAMMFNQRFIKSRKITTSNWSQPQLSPQQLLYAANDAYAALKVMRALNLPTENLTEVYLPTF